MKSTRDKETSGADQDQEREAFHGSNSVRCRDGECENKNTKIMTLPRNLKVGEPILPIDAADRDEKIDPTDEN